MIEGEKEKRDLTKYCQFFAHGVTIVVEIGGYSCQLVVRESRLVEE